MADKQLIFRVHALRRMVERRISKADIKKVLNEGEIIESYPDDMPYPSKLMLGWSSERPLHVVAAENREENQMIIITAYEPDPTKWGSGLKKRKPE